MSNRSDIYYSSGGWDSLNLSENNVIFSICIIAAVLHIHLWLLVFIHKTKFDLTFLFSAGYLSTDLFLILCYLIQYTIRVQSWIPITRWSCYFEAYSMLYFNSIESYCLAALNICRYWHIVRNENIYITHRRKLIFISVLVSLLFFVNYIIQNRFTWCMVIEEPGASCSVIYTNIPVQIWNLTVLLVVPIFISLTMLFRALNFLRNYHAQQRIVRRNHHRRLIRNSLIFYSFWLTLWLPSMCVTFLSTEDMNASIVFISSVANSLEILADPIVASFLDKRFAGVWKKFYQKIQHLFGCHRHARINPIAHIAAPH